MVKRTNLLVLLFWNVWLYHVINVPHCVHASDNRLYSINWFKIMQWKKWAQQTEIQLAADKAEVCILMKRTVLGHVPCVVFPRWEHLQQTRLMVLKAFSEFQNIFLRKSCLRFFNTQLSNYRALSGFWVTLLFPRLEWQILSIYYDACTLLDIIHIQYKLKGARLNPTYCNVA